MCRVITSYSIHYTKLYDQTGKAVLAPVVGNTAQLCMFPYYQEENIYYSITVTNVGDSVAQDIVVDGRSENDWSYNFV